MGVGTALQSANRFAGVRFWFLWIVEAAAAAVGMINAVGSVAGFAGPYLFGYLNTRTGTFSYGLALMMVSALAGGLLILCTPRSAQSATRAAR